jgi:hypothetical protein
LEADITIILSSDNCTSSTPLYNYGNNGVFGAVLCPSDETVGQSTVIIGATSNNSRFDTEYYPSMLAQAFTSDSNATALEYVVTCTIMPPTVSYMTLNYSLSDGDGSAFGFYQIVGNEHCEPVNTNGSKIATSDLLTQDMLMASGGSPQSLLLEGWYVDGVPTTLLNAIQGLQPNQTMLFNNSKKPF